MVVVNIGSFRFIVSEVFDSWIGTCFYVREAHCYVSLSGRVIDGNDIMGF